MSNKAKKNLIFGISFDDKFRNDFFNKKTSFDLKYYFDLFASQYSTIQELTQTSIVLKDESDSTAILDPERFSISNISENDFDSMIIWNRFNDYILKVLTKLEIVDISVFGIRQIEIFEIGTNVKDLDEKEINFLKINKIFDNNTELTFKSSKYYYKKKNKNFTLRIEPFLEDSKFLFLDLDVHFNLSMPIQNINEVVKQEIKYFNIIKQNLLKNYVSTKP